MSYSFNVTTDPGDDVEVTIEDAADAYREQNHPNEDVSGALATGCGAAIAIVKSGAVGDPERYGLAVSVMGHANPNHAPAAGWGNDFVQIAVHQR